MDTAQVALKLMLDELTLPAAIKTVGQRKSVQKGVYLCQAAGVDLGYRYNWYVMGPYSPSLTRDYFALDEALSAGDDPAGYELQDDVKRRLARVRALLDVPTGVDLPLSDWLELLASVHYLVKQRRLPPARAAEQLRHEKPHVAAFTDVALRMLEDQQLIPA